MNSPMIGCAKCRLWFPEAELKRWCGVAYCVQCFPRSAG
jgi:hypothetical protein